MGILKTGERGGCGVVEEDTGIDEYEKSRL